MKKTMAKILSVVCAIALALSVCTFSVMAEESVLGALTAEKLAVSNGVNQLPTCIVNNLTLPEIEGVTWESSNPAVLAADGTVTRPVAEDAEVTLTATAGEETKTFNFTVKAQTTEVHVQDSFAYASRDEFIARGNTSHPWYSNGADTTSELETDANGNQYAKFDLTTSNAQKRKALDVKGDMIYIDFDMKANPTELLDFQLYVKGKKISDSSEVEIAFGLFRLNNVEGAIRPISQSSLGNFGLYDTENFVPVRIRIDMVNKEFYITATRTESDGSLKEVGPYTMVSQRSTDSYTAIFDDLAFDTVSMFEIKRAYTSKETGDVSIDNFTIYTKKSIDDILPTLSADVQFDYIIGDLQERFPLTDNAAITSARTFELPTYGGIVSWTDEKGAALSESVTLSQNQTTFNSGKLIATIAPNGSDAKTYTYAYSVLPLETNVRTRNSAKSTFNFDGDWVAPQTMNNTPYTEMEFKVNGTTGEPIPDGITLATEYESDSEVANKVAKFVNNVTPVNEGDTGVRTVSITQGGGAQVNMRMQIGVDFKLVEGNNVSIVVAGAENTVNVSMDFENGTVMLTERSNDVINKHNPESYYTYNLADFGVTKNSWNRLEIDYSAVGYVYDVYFNGIKANDNPLNCGHISGNTNYYNNPFRFFNFSISTGSTLLLDNVTVAETAQKNANALVEGTMRRIEKNFLVDSAFANGETLYNDLTDSGALPAVPYPNNVTPGTPTITWKLDGVALAEVDSRVPLSFTGMDTHTLEATVSYGSVSKTKAFTITGAPVALRILDRLVPGVKLGSDISGKLIVATYTDSTMKTLDSVKIYNYVNGVKEDGEFDSLDYKKHVPENSKLFFINSDFAPLAFDVAR